jgi:hypothetical protein
MRKLTLVFLILIGAITCFFLQDTKSLKIEKKYTIINETNDKVPGTIYYRNVDVNIGGKTENVYELVIFFDKELKMKLNPIIVVPKYKLIGVVEGGERGFIKFGNKIFQLSDESNKFTLLNNTTFFDDPPIKKMSFEEESITFNSFEGLKKYGQTIILKK